MMNAKTRVSSEYYLGKARLCRKQAEASRKSQAQLLKKMAALFEAAAQKCKSDSSHHQAGTDAWYVIGYQSFIAQSKLSIMLHEAETPNVQQGRERTLAQRPKDDIQPD